MSPRRHIQNMLGVVVCPWSLSAGEVVTVRFLRCVFWLTGQVPGTVCRGGELKVAGAGSGWSRHEHEQEAESIAVQFPFPTYIAWIPARECCCPQWDVSFYLDSNPQRDAQSSFFPVILTPARLAINTNHTATGVVVNERNGGPVLRR